jgi:hypothetical protein
MKKKLILVTCLFLYNFICLGQNIPPAPENKAVVYFVRTSSLGFAINFSYFDSATFIGKTNGPNYIRYECEPGKHVFWVRSENRSFVEAELDAGKIYFLEAIPEMGALKAQVELKPVDPVDGKTMQKIFKLINKRSPETFTEEQLKQNENMDVITRGLDKYNDDKATGKKIRKLEKTAFYNKS